MNQNRRKVVNPQEKLGSQEVTDSENDLLAEIYKNIDELYKMRLVEKIARPIDVRSK